MRAWDLLLSLTVLCAGCATLPVERPADRYGGPPLHDIENFDRAGIDAIRGRFQPGRQPDRDARVFASADGVIVAAPARPQRVPETQTGGRRSARPSHAFAASGEI